MKNHAARRLRRALAAATVASSLALAGCGDSPESLLVKARESIEKNDPKAAEIHLKNLLQKADNAEARFLLGTLYLQAGDPRSAEKELERALQAGFDAGRVVVPLADAKLQLGEPRAVIELAGKGSPSNPEEKAKLATLIGRAHQAMGRAGEARASFESALAASPGFPGAQVGLIALQAGTGDIAGASTAIDQVLAAHPGSAEALALKGDLELAQRRPREAREFFRKAFAANPYDRQSLSKVANTGIDLKEYEDAQKALDSLKKITGPAAMTMHLQALLYARQDKLEQARGAIEAALKAAPDYLPAMALGAEIYSRTNALEQAERLARRIIERAPNSTMGYRLLGSTLMRMNAPEKALQAVQPVLDKDAKDPALYALAGEAALRMNDPAKSAQWYAKAVALDPEDPRNKTGLALAHLAGGDRARGIAELEQVSLQEGSGTQADFALVSAHLRERQWDKALAAIDRLEKKQPDSALVANLRGSALAGKGDTPGARKAFEQALQRDPKLLTAASNLAALDARERKFDDAKKRYTTLLQADPKNVGAMLALAQLIQGTAGKDDAAAADEALGWLRKARDADRASVPAVLALAGWYVGRDRAKEAIPLLQEALAAAPDNAQLLSALGTAYLRSDQDALGMETLERVLRARPNDAGLQMRMGQLKLSRGDAAGAMSNFRKAAELQPKALEPRLAMAAALGRDGKFDEARRIAATLQKDAPKSPAGLVLEGDIAMAERKPGEAAAAYRKALAIQNAPPIAIKLHGALAAGGNAAEADAFLQGQLKARPDDLGLRMYAGEQDVVRQRWAAAVAHYDVVIARQPTNALALNNAAWALHELGDPKAREYAERALAAAPKSPAGMDTLGVILSRAGEHKRAVELLREATAGAPKAPVIRLHLAEALIAADDKAAARTELDTVLKDAPTGSVAEQAKKLQGRL